jgi:outer membrane lipoprotein SlyB
MKKIHIIIVLLIILLLIITIRSQSENAGTVNSNSKNLSNEAVQNIASVYANTIGTATFNNLRATGKITGNLDGDVKGNLTGNVTGNVIGNVNGDIRGNITGSVIGSVIGQANIRDKQNNNDYLIFVEENTNALSITPRKSDKSDYDWSKRLNIENGNMTINGIINARAIVGGSTTINSWRQRSFPEYAATQFRRSDPDGTHKTFIFRKSDSNHVWIISFIKLENFIIGYRHQEHKNFKNGDTDWMREIPA